MMLVKVFWPDADNSPDEHIDVLEAFITGVEKKSDTEFVPLSEGYSECDFAVVFGVGKFAVESSWPRGSIIYEHKFRARKPVIIIEKGFIHRDEYFGVAINGLNGLGNFFNKNSPDDRFKALGVEIKPWDIPKPGGHILLCGQVPWDASVQHSNHVQWCIDMYSELKSLSDRPVIFRPHPETKDYDYGGLPKSEKTLEEDLENCHCVVTFNSTSAALALLDGYPVFATDPGSMAYSLVGDMEINKRNIEYPRFYDREQWAYDLAYAQWTKEEMASGMVWERILNA